MSMPRYAQDAITSQGGGGGGSFNGSQFGSGVAGVLGGLFGDSQGPYHEYNDWLGKSEDTQNPFYNAGKQGLGNYQDWLGGQKDPANFINNLTSQYKESPYARYQQQQSVRAGQNAASASGLSGSTPFAQQLQQNAQNISSQDQNTWLQNVLGINTQYGQGQKDLAGMGQHAADNISNIQEKRGEAAFGARSAQNQDFWNTIGGGAQIAASLLGG